jgi:hypothetical protein
VGLGQSDFRAQTGLSTAAMIANMRTLNRWHEEDFGS